MTNPKLEVLTPQNSEVIFIDHQPQMAFGVHEGRHRGSAKAMLAVVAVGWMADTSSEHLR